MDEPIKSLDELKKGDVVMTRNRRPYIVHAIGDVLEHEKEVVLCRLWDFGISFDHRMNLPEYPVVFLKESEVGDLLSEKVNPKDYKGYKYVSPQILE